MLASNCSLTTSPLVTFTDCSLTVNSLPSDYFWQSISELLPTCNIMIQRSFSRKSHRSCKFEMCLVLSWYWIIGVTPEFWFPPSIQGISSKHPTVRRFSGSRFRSMHCHPLYVQQPAEVFCRLTFMLIEPWTIATSMNYKDSYGKIPSRSFTFADQYVLLGLWNRVFIAATSSFSCYALVLFLPQNIGLGGLRLLGGTRWSLSSGIAGTSIT